MEQFKNILYVFKPTNSNYAGLKAAERTAQKNKAKLTILCLLGSEKSLIEHRKEIEASVKKRVRNLVKRAKATFEFVVAHTPVEIVSSVIIKNYDLVILEHEPKSRFKRFFYGSTALTLLRKSPSAVWIVNPDAPTASLKNVLAAVDTYSEEQNAEAMNKNIVNLALSMANRNRAQCHIVHAWNLGYETVVENPYVNVSAEELKPELDSARRKHSRRFREFLKRARVDKAKVKTKLVHGEASIALSTYVDSHDIDLIVMGTVQRSGIQGLLMGRTAEDLLGQVNCEILAIKSEGFKSPVGG